LQRFPRSAITAGCGGGGGGGGGGGTVIGGGLRNRGVLMKPLSDIILFI